MNTWNRKEKIAIESENSLKKSDQSLNIWLPRDKGTYSPLKFIIEFSQRVKSEDSLRKISVREGGEEVKQRSEGTYDELKWKISQNFEALYYSKLKKSGKTLK